MMLPLFTLVFVPLTIPSLEQTNTLRSCTFPQALLLKKTMCFILLPARRRLVKRIPQIGVLRSAKALLGVVCNPIHGVSSERDALYSPGL